MLTCICCFSRWCWSCPIHDRTAETIAQTLLTRVTLGMAMFPAALRSDSAREFVLEVVAAMNSALEIRHIAGASYRPQSQGMVESLHKTMNGVIRGLVADHPEDWESRVPFAECIVRNVPLKSLGGRSPFEVVTGLKPRLPRALDVTQVIESVDVHEYVRRLTPYFRDTYRDIEGIQREQVEKRETTLDGYLSAELQVGDVVAIRREASARREGPLRFQQRTNPDLYRVKAKVGTHTDC